jgi:hypothetical protein
VKCEYRIQDGGCPGAGIPNILDEKRSALKSQHQTLVQQYPDADTRRRQLFNLLGDIEDVAGHTPASVGESPEWAAIVNAADENGVSYCKGVHGKPLFSAMCGTYTVTLDELKDLLRTSTLAGQQTTQEGSGHGHRRFRY